MSKRRNRAKQTVPFKDRLASFANDLRKEASTMVPCERRDDLLKRARRADTAVNIDDWAHSPGSRPSR
jgi:hypothetical protein